MTEGPLGPGWWQASDGRWYPPEAWYATPPRDVWATPRSEKPSADKVNPVVAVVFGSVLALVVFLAVIGVVIGRTFTTKRRPLLIPPPPLTVQPGRPSGYSGPSYPGSGVGDHVADPSGRVDALGYTVTVKNFARVDASNGLQLCGSVSYTNTSARTAAYDFFLDWRLQQPNGTAITPNPNGDIRSGSLEPGASTSAEVCFDDRGARGQYVLIWFPLSLGSSQRGIWLFQLP